MAEDPKKPAAPAAPAPAPRTASGEMPRQATGQARVNAAAVKAKIAFQGDDEFSVASLDPESWKPPVKIAEGDVQEKEGEHKPEDGSFIWKAFRRVFSR